ncbi:MucR family transcriptional regulator [Methylobacterium durans]|uniref:MucR family transcriptional regulator n=1 Tax=Methylobacterium durans TaxID=2202825 RepID=A0A2U8W2U7_9HYPH|nr:MucR family transcriptional regulator [Methylobacterium durans]AWN39596.1 MucR family transcriptional regulator [Methylobacterium durans]
MSDTAEAASSNHLDLTVDIVSAYLSNNHASASDLPGLVASVHAALAGLSQSAAPGEPEVKLTPAQIKKSITPEALISFEDGKPYKTLRRHLTIRGLTPESYREKWGLPRDYPMVSASYSEQRSSLAKSLGLGQQRNKAATKAAATAETVSALAPAAEAPKGRGTRKKAAEAPAKPRTRRKAAEPALAE